MDREKKQQEWLSKRARPYETKEVTFRRLGKKNAGLKSKELITPGICPCAICNHEYMWECEEADCQCCSSACT